MGDTVCVGGDINQNLWPGSHKRFVLTDKVYCRRTTRSTNVLRTVLYPWGQGLKYDYFRATRPVPCTCRCSSRRICFCTISKVKRTHDTYHNNIIYLLDLCFCRACDEIFRFVYHIFILNN